MSNLKSLKELYRDNFKEEDLIEVTSINGNKFYMIGDDGRFTSVLAAGYIILENGNFVTVEDNQDHDDVFSYFISHYFDEEYMEYESGKAAIKLNQAGLPVYFGVKVKYIPQIMQSGSADNYNNQSEISRLNSGLGILSIPADKNLTNSQRVNMSKFLITNNKQTPKGVEKRLSLTYGNIETQTIYSSEEFDAILSPNEECEKTKNLTLLEESI